MPVRASTLILVRGEGDKFQIYLLKRSSQSGFMPGNYVFPGGVVDPEDIGLDFWKGHVDMDPGQVKRRFGRGLNIEDAMAHGIAAIRETFEEAGILLARQHGGTVSFFLTPNPVSPIPDPTKGELLSPHLRII